MRNVYQIFVTIDTRATSWMARHGIAFLRISLGVVFFWFGALKFFSGLSPAQDLATRTISILTFDLVPAPVAMFFLASWECLIGVGLIWNRLIRVTLLLLWMQMLGTITPIFFFPHEVFTRVPWAPTLEGQYIIKNIVLVSAGIVIGATARGGILVPERNWLKTKVLWRKAQIESGLQ